MNVATIVKPKGYIIILEDFLNMITMIVIIENGKNIIDRFVMLCIIIIIADDQEEQRLSLPT